MYYEPSTQEELITEGTHRLSILNMPEQVISDFKEYGRWYISTIDNKIEPCSPQFEIEIRKLLNEFNGMIYHIVDSKDYTYLMYINPSLQHFSWLEQEELKSGKAFCYIICKRNRYLDEFKTVEFELLDNGAIRIK